MEVLEGVVQENDIEVGIIAVPAGEAQKVASQLVRAGVGGILNFAPVHLQVPEHVHLECVDISVSLEKVAFFARQEKLQKEAVR
jgi:redox-sensing transcriptional repressor